MPALIRKVHEAKLRGDSAVVIWGTGSPRREFLQADDCAEALVFLMKNYSGMEHVNVGSGEDITILDLAKLICDVIGYRGEIRHDLSRPDGTPRKLMDVSRLAAMGWKAKIALTDGIAQAYRCFLAEMARDGGVRQA
jgi:GDP-L-fucose synthase